MEISLVICTRNRCQQLQRTLDATQRFHNTPNWELVVVDNGSTDDTGRYLRQWAHTFRRPIHVLYEPTPGLGRARNLGWQASQGKIIAFTDDDCYPAADYLIQVLTCFEEQPIDFLGGRILLYDPTDYPLAIQRLAKRVTVRPRTFIPAGLIQGANMSFRRSALEAVEGFDPHLGAGTPFPCEDVEILARLSDSGCWGAYDPHPLVYHHHQRKTRPQVRAQKRAYDKGRGAYYAKCLMNTRLRRRYIRSWLLSAWLLRPVRTWRELQGGVHFLKQSSRHGTDENAPEGLGKTEQRQVG